MRSTEQMAVGGKGRGRGSDRNYSISICRRVNFQSNKKVKKGRIGKRERNEKGQENLRRKERDNEEEREKRYAFEKVNEI